MLTWRRVVDLLAIVAVLVMSLSLALGGAFGFLALVLYFMMHPLPRPGRHAERRFAGSATPPLVEDIAA